MNKPKTITEIFNDLDDYRDFCVKFGRVFNEAALYKERDHNYNDYLKYKEKKRIPNHWVRDKNRFR